jgi:hypothetical protein
MFAERDQLYEVKVGNSVADGTEQCRAVVDEDDVSLLIHRPNKVRKLNSEFSSFTSKVPGNPTSSAVSSSQLRRRRKN